MVKRLRKSVKHSLIFIIALVISLSLINFIYINQILVHKNFYKNNFQFDSFSKTDIKILILGDSHPAYGLNPNLINHSFNYAVPSEDYEQNFIKLNKSYSKLDNVEIIILPFDLNSFKKRVNPYQEIRFWQNFLTLNELSKKTNKSLFQVKLLNKFPFIGKGADFKILFQKNKITEMELGWQNHTNIYIETPQTSKPNLEEIEINDNLLLNFKKILKFSEENNITIFLIKFPLVDSYLDSFSNYSINSYYNTLESEIKEYKNIKILDYQNLTLNYSYFNDVDHLNYMGAELFSKLIEEDINNFLNESN